MMNRHDINELQEMQALPLSLKVKLTKDRIRAWYEHFGGGVYVSFSGGKDSTVLLDICRQMYGDELKGMFVNTGLEYPEVVEHVKQFPNIDIIRPEMTFKQVVQKYGYPFFTKEQSSYIYECRHTKSEKLRRIRMGEEEGRKWSAISQKYRFMLEAPFEVNDRCCDYIKKRPSERYERETGLKPIVGTMASESKLRTMNWMKYGCNAFEKKRQTSQPLSFWTEQDILEYIYVNNIKIPSVYGEVVIEQPEDNLEGQMRIDQLDPTMFGIFDLERPIYKVTGRRRTGCMFCMYGIQFEKYNEEFLQMKKDYPKQFEWIMKPECDGGLGYKEKIDWINEHGKFDIKY